MSNLTYNCEDIKQKILEGWHLIDVREPFEFNAGHVKGAKNVPLANLDLLEEGNNYLLYCRSGGRSGAAENYLKKKNIQALNIGGLDRFLGCLE